MTDPVEDDDRPLPHRPILRTSRQNTMETAEEDSTTNVPATPPPKSPPARNVRFSTDERPAQKEQHVHVSQKDLPEAEGVRLLRETSLRRRERLLNAKVHPRAADLDVEIEALMEELPPSPNPQPQTVAK